MSVKFSDVFSKTDWAKIIILLITAIIAWGWVYIEIQKPLVAPATAEEIVQEKN